ncbi:MAG: hypothetical protein IJ074_01985 [Clostridia bacterium]|nr:hypothetical protein [Clostridia bacterium]
MAAKKSAKSKGYRKTVAKKPYLSKKEIILTCAIVVALVLAVVLFNIFYSDGSLKVVDGVAQTEGAHSILVNTGTASSPKYFKLGQVSEVEGYDLEEVVSTTDENIKTYTYVPSGDSPITNVTVGGFTAPAESYAEYVSAVYGSIEGYNMTEVQTANLLDRDVYYLTTRADPEVIAATIAAAQEALDAEAAEAETTEEAVEETTEAIEEATEEIEEEVDAVAEEAAEEDAAESEADATEDDENNVGYMQELIAYVPVGERCIGVHITNNAESDADYVEDDALMEILKQIYAGLSFETK